MRFGPCVWGCKPAVLALLFVAASLGDDEPPGLRERFLERIKADLGRLPDFVCTQDIERFSHLAADKPWQKTDTLRFDVALVGDHEMYSLPGARSFRSRTPAALARGTVTTGQLALLARHVFLTSTAEFTYRGETEQNGRASYEFSYDVSAARSSYRLRSNTAESVVAFQGSFWIARDNLDLVRLEVQAYDIPRELRVAEAEIALDYSRIPIDSVPVLLPVAASLRVEAVDGEASLNRTRLTSCKHYRSESTIRFAVEAAPDSAETPSAVRAIVLPHGALLDLMLDSSVDPATAKIGDAVRATLAHAIKDGESVIVPQGVPVTGRVVRLDKTSMPFPIYQVGLQFESVEVDGRAVPISATMIDAGPAAGLLRQAKRMDPTFTKKRNARMDILVREIQRGQGLLEWDARHTPIPRGLHMKWLVQQDELTTAEDSKAPGIERQRR